MDKWIIIHPTHLLPNPFMTQPAHLPPLGMAYGPILLLSSFISTLIVPSVPLLILNIKINEMIGYN